MGGRKLETCLQGFLESGVQITCEESRATCLLRDPSGGKPRPVAHPLFSQNLSGCPDTSNSSFSGSFIKACTSCLFLSPPSGPCK